MYVAFKAEFLLSFELFFFTKDSLNWVIKRFLVKDSVHGPFPARRGQILYVYYAIKDSSWRCIQRQLTVGVAGGGDRAAYATWSFIHTSV